MIMGPEDKKKRIQRKLDRNSYEENVNIKLFLSSGETDIVSCSYGEVSNFIKDLLLYGREDQEVRRLEVESLYPMVVTRDEILLLEKLPYPERRRRINQVCKVIRTRSDWRKMKCKQDRCSFSKG